ncbi:hypothetical protein K438DRAFT_1982752 [Mycena galopus ATCC 62051]|nr:hypothetical protein K438DRAFT_1982752 [Mycena galopus ATCC 62051]
MSGPASSGFATKMTGFMNHPAALTATGFIWVRWSFVIVPVNHSLAAVNFLVGLSGLTQLARIANYHYNQPAAAAEKAS